MLIDVQLRQNLDEDLIGLKTKNSMSEILVKQFEELFE